MCKKKIKTHIFGMSVLLLFILTISCTSTVVRETEYTAGGEVAYQSEKVDNNLIYELRKVFANTKIEGVGMFENENEGLARSTALELAVNDLAASIQTETKRNSTIYNNSEVRTVVETKVHALVKGYQLETEGYEPNTFKYRVKIYIEGEQLIRSIEKMIVNK